MHPAGKLVLRNRHRAREDLDVRCRAPPCRKAHLGEVCPCGSLQAAPRVPHLDGRIAEEGGPELADRLEAEGYDRFLEAAN